MGRARARRGAHASPIEQPSSPTAPLAGLGFVASPISRFAAAGGRELSETMSSVNIRVRLMSSERGDHGAVGREPLRLLRERQ